MSFLNLTDETWLDLTVNIIPLGILLVLDALFWVVNPWGWDPFYVLMAHFLTLFPFAVLSVVTYFGGALVQRDEGATAALEERETEEPVHTD